MSVTKLKAWRERERLTLQEISDLTGYTPMMISLAERGKRNFSRQGKVLLSRRLGVSLATLFEVEKVDEDALINPAHC